MKTHMTQAESASRELKEILGHENRIYQPWQLESFQIEPVRLMTTAEEMLLLTFANAYVRPSFEVTENHVVLPGLFCKVNGAVDGLILDLQAKAKEEPEVIALYKGFQKMSRPPRTNYLRTRPSWFDDTLGIHVDKAMKEHMPEIRNLRPSYQRNYFEAINRVLRLVKTDALMDDPPTPREILEVLLFNNRKVIDMYHHFDYQYTVPKMVVVDQQNRPMSVYAAIRLLFMRSLGFDVFVISKEGYASIENFIKDSLYDAHHLSKQAYAFSETLSTRKRAFRLVVLTLLGLVGCIVAWNLIIQLF